MAYNEIRTINNIQLEDIKAREEIEATKKNITSLQTKEDFDNTVGNWSSSHPNETITKVIDGIKIPDVSNFVTNSDFNTKQEEQDKIIDTKADKKVVETLQNTKADKSDLVNGLHFKGTATYSALPASDNNVGDFYYVTDGDGTNGEGNYAWNGTSWNFSGKTTNISTDIIDNTLSVSGKAAGAKAAGDAISQLKEDLTNVKNLKKTEKIFNNWANGTWNRGSKPNYTPTFIRRNDRIAFAELTFLQKGAEISVEKYDGQKYAIARWTKNKDVWTNVEYSDWFTDNQVRKIEEDEYLSVACAMADGTSNITKNDIRIVVHLYENYNLLDAIKPKTELKPYFAEELNDTIKKINALQTEPCLVFPLITDIHYDPRSSILQNFNDTITIIKKMRENISFDFILNLGDNINGSSNKELVLSDARYMLNSFKNIGLPYLFALGNHDTNYDPSPKFTISETYGAFYSATPKTAKINANSNGTDFYIDYDELKIRIVSLNSNYLNSMFISDSSANWFKNAALNTNNVVVFCIHESPINTQNWAATTVYNGDFVKEQINNFIANGGTLIQLFGHSHADYNFSTPWLSIASNCGKFEQSNLDTDEYRAITGYDGNIVAPERVQGTDTEQSFSVVVVRPTIKKINLVRFGAGLDREFGY